MRAPILNFPRTRTPNTRQGYFDASAIDANAMGAGVARGANALASGLVDLAATLQQRNDAVNKFKFLTDFTNFETKAVEQQTELKRQAPPEVTDFPETSGEAFDKMADDFAGTLADPELQAMFGAKRADLKQRLTLDAHDFQFKSQDSFFTAGLNDSYQVWRNRLNADRSLMPEAIKDLTEKLQTVEMDPAVKIKLAQDMRAGLESAAYANHANEIAMGKAKSGAPPGYAESAQTIKARLQGEMPELQAAMLAGNIQAESGFQTWAVNNEEGAHGLIQWRLDRWDELQAAAVKAGRDWRDPEFQTNFLINEFKTNYPEAWAKFMSATTPQEAQAALKVYIGYKDVAGQSSAGRIANAQAILGGANPVGDTSARYDDSNASMLALNADPQYAHVPLEDRIAMTNAADARADEASREAQKAMNEALKQKVNQLKLDLHDGNADQEDIVQARKDGWLTDYEDIHASEQILKERNAGIAAATGFQSVLDNNGVGYNRVTMNSGSSDAFNKWVGEDGLKRISAMDDKYMHDVLLPAVGKVADIPTDVVGQLQSMAQSNDPTASLWAYKQLGMMSDLSRDAIRQRTTEDFQLKVDNYRDMVGSFSDKDMFDFLKGGSTPERQKAAEHFDKVANDLLNDPSTNIYNKMTNVTTLWFDPGIAPNSTEVTDELRRWTRAQFRANFRASGDEKKAWASTIEQGQARWGNSSFGGDKWFTEYPVEKTYPPIDGGFDAYDTQVRSAKEIGLADTDRYRVVADQQTRDEVDAYKRGTLGRLPSYRIRIIHESGTEVDAPVRWWGDLPVVGGG